MKKQGGQDIIEFTLMVPLFFVCLFAIMAGGLFFRDYITYNSVVRSAAREASLVVAQDVKEEKSEQPKKFSEIEGRIYNEFNKENKENPHLYSISKLSDISITGTEKDSEGKVIPLSIRVTLTTTRNPENYNPFIRGVANIGIILPDTQKFTYYMYWENNTKNNSKVQP